MARQNHCNREGSWHEGHEKSCCASSICCFELQNAMYKKNDKYILNATGRNLLERMDGGLFWRSCFWDEHFYKLGISLHSPPNLFANELLRRVSTACTSMNPYGPVWVMWPLSQQVPCLPHWNRWWSPTIRAVAPKTWPLSVHLASWTRGFGFFNTFRPLRLI